MARLLVHKADLEKGLLEEMSANSDSDSSKIEDEIKLFPPDRMNFLCVGVQASAYK